MSETNNLPPEPDSSIPDTPEAPVATPTNKTPMKIILVVAITLVAIAGGVVLGSLFAGGTLGSGFGRSAATAILQVNIDDLKPEEGSIAQMKVSTHAQLVGERDVLNRALGLDDDPQNDLALNIRSLEWFEEDPATAADRLEAALQVEPLEGTSLIAVRVRTSDPETSARLATAVAQAYVLDTRDATERSALAQLRELHDQKVDYERDADECMMELRRLAAGSAPPALLGSVEAMLREQVAKKNALTKEFDQLKAELAALEEAGDVDALLATKEVQDALLIDPAYSALVAQEALLASELDALIKLHEPEHPSVTTLKTKLESVVSQREQREVATTEDLIPNTRLRVETIMRQIAMLEADIQMNEARITQIVRTQSELDAVESQRATTQEHIAELDRRIDELKIGIRSNWQVRMQSMAEVPSK